MEIDTRKPNILEEDMPYDEYVAVFSILMGIGASMAEH